MLKPALQLKLGQQLTMTPQLQQAIRLLQLPVLECRPRCRRRSRPTSCSRGGGGDHRLASIDQPAPQGEDSETLRRRLPRRPRSASRWRTPGRVLDPVGRGPRARRRRPAARVLRRAQARPAPAPDLAARGQQARRAAGLDRRGHRRRTQRRRLLTESVEAIARSLNVDLPVTEEDVDSTRVRADAGPTGVGARTVAECIGPAARPARCRDAGSRGRTGHRSDHLQSVADRDSAHCATRSAPTRKTLEAALALIRGCNHDRARPSRARSRVHRPDVFVRRTDQGWSVEINPGSMRASGSTRTTRAS